MNVTNPVDPLQQAHPSSTFTSGGAIVTAGNHHQEEELVTASLTTTTHKETTSGGGLLTAQGNEKNLCITHLPASVDAKYLRELFEPFGTIASSHLLLDVTTGLSRGLGFVLYEEEPAAKEALQQMNKAKIHGAVIQVRLADSKHNTTMETRGKIVYFRNIPGDAKEEEIRAMFEKFGEVTHITHHPQSTILGGGSPYNMTFVSFATEDTAAAAIAEVDGKMIFPRADANHPRILAKIVTDIAKEKRKSVISSKKRSGKPSTTRTSEKPSKANMFASPPVRQRAMGAPLFPQQPPAGIFSPPPPPMSMPQPLQSQPTPQHLQVPAPQQNYSSHLSVVPSPGSTTGLPVAIPPTPSVASQPQTVFASAPAAPPHASMVAFPPPPQQQVFIQQPNGTFLQVQNAPALPPQFTPIQPSTVGGQPPFIYPPRSTQQ